MSKIMCFISSEFADFEVTLALHKLRTIGKKEIISVAYTKSAVVSESGLNYSPDLTIDEVLQSDITNIEALLLPGGPLREKNDKLVALIQKFDQEGKLLAAICNGPQYLGDSGILHRHLFTTSATPEKVQSFGKESAFFWENFRDFRVMRDGNIITAKGRAFVDFAFAIFDYLGVYLDYPEQQSQLWSDILNL